MPTPKRAALDADAVWNYALRLIAGRAMSIGELRAKLAARAASPADVDAALSRLKEMRLLNDRQFADSFAASRRDGRGLGKARTLRELAQKQVPRIVAQTAVDEAYKEVDEVAHAVAFLQRKLRIPDHAAYFEDPRHVQSAYRKLRYNGFSSAAAVAALKRWSAKAQDLEDLPDED